MTGSVAVAGERIGSFEIEALIGVGGMAEVYRARHVEIGNSVAVKVIRLPGGADADTAGRRFLDEARLMAALDDTNIVRVIDAGVSDGRAYLAMPLMRDSTLKERLATARLPRTEVRRIVGCLAQALDHAHARGVVHRDVKPGNVLIDRENVRLADFGISRVLDKVELTESISQRATPLYMSPEQAAGSTGPGIDQRSDLYSLAVVAYEMLTGTTPITGDNPLEVMKDHVSYVPPPASQHDPTLPRAADAVLARGLAKDPAARHASATEFAAALAAALDAEAATIPHSRRSWPMPRRSDRTAPPNRVTSRRPCRWPRVAAVVAAAALVAAGVLIWWPRTEPDRGVLTPDAPRGALFYRTDFDDDLAAGFIDKVGRSPEDARVEIADGQLELAGLTPQANPGTELRLSQGATTYVADLAFGVRPGSDVLFCMGLRWAVPGSSANELCVNTAEKWVELAIWDGENHVPMAPPTPVPDLLSGRTVSTTILVDRTHFALWLDGVKVVDVENGQVPVKATYPGLDVYPFTAGTVDIRRLQLSRIAD